MRRAGRLLRTLILFASGGFGCAGSQDPAGMGKDCYRDEDCKIGLVCVADTTNNRVCSSDVTSLASSVEGPPADAGAPVDDAAVPGAGGAQ